jgi:hypothetical protein
MQSMVRYIVIGFACAVTLLGCAAGGTKTRAAATAPKGSQFTTEEQRQMACLDLRDHIVSLYADEYVEQQGLALSRAERTAFRDGWAQELARQGTFERFEQSCFYGLTPRKYQCGMASSSPDGLAACMKLSARD